MIYILHYGIGAIITHYNNCILASKKGQLKLLTLLHSVTNSLSEKGLL